MSKFAIGDKVDKAADDHEGAVHRDDCQDGWTHV